MTGKDSSKTPQTRRGPEAPRGEIRARLLASAQTEFSHRPYQQVTVREIAAGAGVDPSLINYYFGSKQKIFRESMSLPEDPTPDIRAALEQGIPGAGERLVKVILDVWEQIPALPQIQALVQTLAQDTEPLQFFRVFFDQALLSNLVPMLSGRDRKLRAQLAASQIIGAMIMRFIIRLEPLASAPKEQIVKIVGAVVQYYLEGGYRTDPNRAAPEKRKTLA